MEENLGHLKVCKRNAFNIIDYLGWGGWLVLSIVFTFFPWPNSM